MDNKIIGMKTVKWNMTGKLQGYLDTRGKRIITRGSWNGRIEGALAHEASRIA